MPIFLRCTLVQKRLFTLSEAADYCGVSIPVFQREFRVSPIVFGSTRLERYDVADLDEAVERMKGDPASSQPDFWVDKVGI